MIFFSFFSSVWHKKKYFDEFSSLFFFCSILMIFWCFFLFSFGSLTQSIELTAKYNFSRTHNKMMSTLFHVSRPTVNSVKISPLMLVLEMLKALPCSPTSPTDTNTLANPHLPTDGKWIRGLFQHPLRAESSYECVLHEMRIWVCAHVGIGVSDKRALLHQNCYHYMQSVALVAVPKHSISTFVDIGDSHSIWTKRNPLLPDFGNFPIFFK